MITFKNLLERAKTEKIAIHIPTEEQAKTLLKALDEKGYEWNSGKKLTDQRNYYENICYGFGKDNKVYYCSLAWYQKEHYTIIEFSDIDFAENTITFYELLEITKIEKIAIHTTTEEQAITLLKELDKNGYKWGSNEKLTTMTRYEIHKEKTCYEFNENKKVYYGSCSFYSKEGHKIIEFTDIFDYQKNDTETKSIFTPEQAIKEIEIYFLNHLHKLEIIIAKPPRKDVLAWFDTMNENLYITSELQRWTPELLYVLPLHEAVHKLCFGLVDNYENGYHNENFRLIFEKLTGMTTFHDEKVGWQFIEKTGDKYYEWLKTKKNLLNEIFRIIKNTDFPPTPENEKEQNGDGDGEEESPQQKMNKLLKQNEQSEEDGDEKAGWKFVEKTGDEEDGTESETTESEKDYEGQKENVVVGGGKKRFRL